MLGHGCRVSRRGGWCLGKAITALLRWCPVAHHVREGDARFRDAYLLLRVIVVIVKACAFALFQRAVVEPFGPAWTEWLKPNQMVET